MPETKESSNFLEEKDINAGLDVPDQPEIPDFRDLFTKSETQIREQIRQFFAESGKRIGFLLLFLIGAIASGEIINAQLLEIALAIGSIVVVAIIYTVWWFWKKDKNQLLADIFGFAQNYVSLAERFTDLHNEFDESRKIIEEMKNELINVKVELSNSRDDNKALIDNLNNVVSYFTDKKLEKNHAINFIRDINSRI